MKVTDWPKTDGLTEEVTPVVVGTGDHDLAVAANSEVLPSGPVAMALTHSPGLDAARPVAVKLALPKPSVVTLMNPR